MDKKILLGGAAALLLGAGLFAAPASAAIEISHSGEATLTATMDNSCSLFAGVLDDNGDTLSNVTDSTYNANAGACSGSEEVPVWDTASKLDWSAGGTLANGLSVSTSQDADINLSGAFGSITFKKGGDSAAKAAAVNAAADNTVAGNDLGGHVQATDGTAGVVVTYAAPSMGGMNLFLSYAPNSDIDADGTPAATDGGATYTDTIGFGANFAMDALSISAGWENATDRLNAGCNTADLSTTVAASKSVEEQADLVYGGTLCGDQTLMNLGATMSAGELAINAGWSDLTTEEADRNTMNIGVGMSAGDYNITLDYVNSTLTYEDDTTKDTQTVIGVGASTSLGDGVDFGVAFSNNTYNIAGSGNHTNYYAEAELKITY